MITVNRIPLEVTLFSDNTSQVWKLPKEMIQPAVNIDWRFQHEGELMHLIQLVDLLRHPGTPVGYISLNMDYLPYARQDKDLSNETTFALQSFTKILNNLKLDKISAIDTHSDAPVFLINNFKNIFPYTHVAAAMRACDPQVLCYPDKGAARRYGKELAFLGLIHIFGEKERDQSTGHIVKYTLQEGVNIEGKRVLIVDDICDGGMTFILLTKALLKNGAKSVNLYTSHGIYSKGLRPLKEANIGRIFTKDGEVSEVQNVITIQPYKD